MGFQFNPLSGQFDQTGAGAAQVNSDWNSTSGVSQILNKPSLFSGAYSALTGIPSTFAPSAHTHTATEVTGLATVATSGSASDLSTGTLALARMNALVSRDDIDNSFTAGQSITAAANTSALTASYSVTGANTTALVNLSGTWNTTGVARGILLNITETGSGSAAGSLLADFQVGGTSRFDITKSGGLYGGSLGRVGVVTPATNATIYWWNANTPNGIGFYDTASNAANNVTSARNGFLDATRLVLNQSAFLGFWSGSGDAHANSDTILRRDAARTLALRDAGNANTLRVYGTFTDASNGRRLDITSTTGGIFTLTATGNGTGASGNLLKLTQPILIPASSVTLATNGDLAFEATSNTSLTIRYRGTDGTTRSASLTLA